MTILSVRKHPQLAQDAIAYFQAHWANQDNAMVYEDCILSSLDATSPLPQWYLLYENNQIIGCAGLVTNDFISRMDLYPWLCALYIEKAHRGHAYGALLIKHIKEEAKKLGFDSLYLCTDHIGYYEHYSFTYMGQGYHPWGHSSRIYKATL